MDFIIDFFLLLIYLLVFLLLIIDFDEQLITNNKLIYYSLFKSWFLLDFLSGIPFNSNFIFLILKLKKIINIILFNIIHYMEIFNYYVYYDY